MRLLRLSEESDKILFWSSGLFLLFFHYGNHWSAHWYSKWALLMGIFSLVYSFEIAKRTSFYFLPILAWSMIEGVRMFAWVFNRHLHELNYPNFVSITKAGAYGYISILVTSLLLVWFPKRLYSSIEPMLATLGGLSIIGTLCQWRLSPFEREGFYGNASMNGGIIAALLPFVITRNPWYLGKALWAIVGILAVFMTNASIPLGVLSVVTLIYVTVDKKIGLKITVPLVLAPVIIGYIIQGRELFTFSGRLETWTLMMDYFTGHNLFWKGAGLASTYVLDPVYTYEAHPNSGQQLFFWMHSDWLQVFFEMGFVGMALALLAWGHITSKTLRSPKLAASWMGWSAMALVNYPLRLPISLLSIILLIRLILNEEGGDERG